MTSEAPVDGKEPTISLNVSSGGSTPTQDSTPSRTESAGLIRGWFSAVKSRFVGAGDSVRSTATNMYHRNYKYFGIAFGCGLAMILLSLFFLPVAILAPRKFCVPFTLGSVCVLASFAFLQEPHAYVASLFSGNRLVFTTCYIGSLIISLYASMVAKSYVATVVATFAQVSWDVETGVDGGAGVVRVLEFPRRDHRDEGDQRLRMDGCYEVLRSCIARDVNLWRCC